MAPITGGHCNYDECCNAWKSIKKPLSTVVNHIYLRYPSDNVTKQIAIFQFTHVTLLSLSEGPLNKEFQDKSVL